MKTGELGQAVKAYVDGGGCVVEVHGDSPQGNMWLAQHLNASDKQKNTHGLFGRNVVLWSANGKILAQNSCKVSVESEGDVPVLLASIWNTVGPVGLA